VQILEGSTRRILEYDREAIAEFLTHHREVTAVFACNDILATLVYEVCQELGIRIPDDLAVVGYDDTTITSLLTPPLTTIRQHAFEMGASAAGLLIDILAGAASEKEIYLPVEMVIRRSCGRHVESQAQETRS
jgi:LacI family transcriptional regulator